MLPPQRRRRGANAIEFGLIAPILMAFLLGIADYGWYFFQEAMVSNALRDAVRLGSLQTQTEDELESGDCDACVTTALSAAQDEFDRFGLGVVSAAVVPEIQVIAGTCAVVVDAEIPFTPLIGFVPVPEVFPIHIAALASNVTSCGA
ncbi:MAG: pilus assembly protein [Deltaproteobacteria bacterium]|nr:pilus assembly protein [Deltaproteobacteria bacterium]